MLADGALNRNTDAPPDIGGGLFLQEQEALASGLATARSLQA